MGEAAPDLAQLNALSAEEIAARLSGTAEERVALVRAAAEAGVAEAQAVYGQMLLDGRDLPADPPAAFRWFAKAAAQEHLQAINMVGRCYDLGWGVAVDKARAAEWFKAAAVRGLAWGMYNYATSLALGEGIAEDRPEALRWLRKAAALGNAKAINFVGSFHEDGWAVERDMTEAARCYALAAEGGDFRGCFNHARMLIDRGEFAEAATWIDRAAATANPAFTGKMTRWLEDAGLHALIPDRAAATHAAQLAGAIGRGSDCDATPGRGVASGK